MYWSINLVERLVCFLDYEFWETLHLKKIYVYLYSDGEKQKSIQSPSILLLIPFISTNKQMERI